MPYFCLKDPTTRRSPTKFLLFWVASDVSLFQPKQKMFLELTLILISLRSNDRFAYDNLNSYLALWLERSASFALLIRPCVFLIDDNCRLHIFISVLIREISGRYSIFKIHTISGNSYTQLRWRRGWQRRWLRLCARRCGEHLR